MISGYLMFNPVFIIIVDCMLTVRLKPRINKDKIMAINLCCSVCYKTYKLNTLKCKCGNNLKRNQLFKVRIKLPDGKWKSKQVSHYENRLLARGWTLGWVSACIPVMIEETKRSVPALKCCPSVILIWYLAIFYSSCLPLRDQEDQDQRGA